MMQTTKSSYLREFWRYAGPDRKSFSFCLVLMFVTLATEYARPLLLFQALEHMESSELGALQNTALLFLATVLIDYLSRSGFSYLISMAVLRTINRIRDGVFQHVLHMKMSFFDRQPVGVLLTRTISDCESLAETLRAGTATIIVDLLSIIVVFAVMIRMDLQLSLVMMIMVPITWLVVRWCGARLRLKFLAVRRALANSNGHMTEGILGVTILQLFRKQRESVAEFQRFNRIYRQATVTSNVYDAILSAVIDGVAAVTTAAILTVAFHVKFGIMEVGALVVYMSLVDRIFVPIRDFSGKFTTVQQARAALERVLALLENPEHMVQGPKRLQGDRLTIAFEKVGFRYVVDGPKVLNDIQFTVKPGQVIALVGQTGSGKSTIGKLLTRAYDGYEGRITVGQIELQDLNYNSLRSKIAVVHQDVELFPAPIRDNISMFDNDISEDRINEAIRIIKAEHMIEHLPGGLYYQVQEGGGNLSAGQLQLIVFARALVHDAPIVLMDEATSSVDSVTESWIQQAIDQIFKHKTVLIVAHRLSTIAAADNILVLHQGQIIEQGTHQELQRIENGYYAGLLQASKLQHGSDSVLV